MEYPITNSTEIQDYPDVWGNKTVWTDYRDTVGNQADIWMAESQLELDEIVDPESMTDTTLSLSDAGGTSVAATTHYRGSFLELVPAAELIPGNTYTVIVAAGVADAHLAAVGQQQDAAPLDLEEEDVDDNRPPILGVLDRQEQGTYYSAYIQDRATFFEKLVITPGLRFTSYDQTSSGYVEPP